MTVSESTNLMLRDGVPSIMIRKYSRPIFLIFFTGGDAATGASLVVEAIGAGRRAARSIHLYLNGEEVKPVPKSLRKKHVQESLFEIVPGVNKTKRTPMPELPVAERIQSFAEADLVIQENDAIYESNRCLSCCRICYNPDK